MLSRSARSTWSAMACVALLGHATALFGGPCYRCIGCTKAHSSDANGLPSCCCPEETQESAACCCCCTPAEEKSQPSCCATPDKNPRRVGTCPCKPPAAVFSSIVEPGLLVGVNEPLRFAVPGVDDVPAFSPMHFVERSAPPLPPPKR